MIRLRKMMKLRRDVHVAVRTGWGGTATENESSELLSEKISLQL